MRSVRPNLQAYVALNQHIRLWKSNVFPVGYSGGVFVSFLPSVSVLFTNRLPDVWSVEKTPARGSNSLSFT